MFKGFKDLIIFNNSTVH